MKKNYYNTFWETQRKACQITMKNCDKKLAEGWKSTRFIRQADHWGLTYTCHTVIGLHRSIAFDLKWRVLFQRKQYCPRFSIGPTLKERICRKFYYITVESFWKMKEDTGRHKIVSNCKIKRKKKNKTWRNTRTA